MKIAFVGHTSILFESQNKIELSLYEWFRLDHKLEVICGSIGLMDSFVAIRDNEEGIFNLNDCVLNLDQLCYIRRRIGKVSGLFTQFSFFRQVMEHFTFGVAVVTTR
jgi:hypothetical protein